MKLWIDAQLPPTLANWLNSNFEVEATALRDLGLRDAQDIEIFNAARDANAAIATKDSDFVCLILARAAQRLVVRFLLVVHETQRLGNEFLILTHETQRLDDELPKLVHETQRLGGEFLILPHETQRLGDEFPTLAREIQRLGNEFPTLARET